MTVTLVFDLDGTLVDTAPDLARATNHVLTSHGRRAVSLDEIRDMVGQGARKLIVRGFEATGTPLAQDRIEPLYREFLDHYTANIAAESRLYDGMAALLDTARGRGYGIAICTNKLEALSVRLIEALGLSARFDAIIGPDTIGIAKPDPAPLREAVSRAGGVIERAIMIGDSRTDIDTARAAAVPVVAVSYGYTDTPVSAFAPDHVVDTAHAILPAIDAILAGRNQADF